MHKVLAYLVIGVLGVSGSPQAVFLNNFILLKTKLQKKIIEIV